MRRDPVVVPGPRRTAAEVVYEALKHDLITLRHRPGAPLTEAELARAYGTSRVPVREACRRLQQEGLLTSIPYKGYFVKEISLKEIADSFELRLVLEGHAVRSAVERARPEEIAELEALAATEYTYHDWSSYGAFLEGNQEFHLQLASLSGNERLVNVLEELLGSMQRFFYLGLDLGDYGREMRGEHEELVRWLKGGRVDDAVGCARRQIEGSRERVLRAVGRGVLDLPLG